MTDERAFRVRLLAIIMAAFALRLAIRAVTGTDRYWIDGYGGYLLLAQGIANGEGYAFPGQGPTAFRVPLYPAFIWAVTGGKPAAWALISAQAALSAATAGLAGLIARRMAGPAAGLIAAALYALWPYAAWHDVSLQESGLFAFLAALATWQLLLARAGRGIAVALAAGAALALGVLTRSTLLPFALGAVVWLALPAPGQRLRASVIRAACAGAALALMLAPWVERTHRITGAAGMGTESGHFLHAAQHPLTFSAYPVGTFDQTRANVFAALLPEERAELARLDEAGKDRWYRARALVAMQENPGQVVAGAVRKLWAAFGPWPVPRHGLATNLAYAAGWVPFLTFAVAGAIRRRRHWREDALLWWHFASFAGLTAVFWAQTSHRSYLDPYVAVFAGIALAALLPRAQNFFRSKAS